MMLKRKQQRYVTKSKIAIEHTAFYPYLVRYLDWLLVKGFSAETARTKDSGLRQFILWCDQRSVESPLADGTPCDDGADCTIDTCYPANGCQSVSDHSSCSDGHGCTSWSSYIASNSP